LLNVIQHETSIIGIKIQDLDTKYLNGVICHYYSLIYSKSSILSYFNPLLTNIQAVGDGQHHILGHGEGGHIANRRQPAGGAVLPKVLGVKVMDQGLDGQQHGVPQRDQLQGNPLLHVRIAVKIVIALHAQIVVLYLHKMIEELKRH